MYLAVGNESFQTGIERKKKKITYINKSIMDSVSCTRKVYLSVLLFFSEFLPLTDLNGDTFRN